jgi:hypothetical protein
MKVTAIPQDARGCRMASSHAADGRPPFGPCRQGDDVEHSDRLQCWRGSRHAEPGLEHQPAGRQCHRRLRLPCGNGRQAHGAPARASAEPSADRRAPQSEPDKVQNGVGGNRRGGTRGRSTHRARRGSNEREIHSAFKRIELLQPQALLVGADPFFNSRREQLVTLAKE